MTIAHDFSNPAARRQILRQSVRMLSTEIRALRRIDSLGMDVIVKTIDSQIECIRALRERHSSHFRHPS